MDEKGYVMGETERGRKIHAVAANVRDGTWTKAACGVEVIAYAGVVFDPTNEIEASALCRSCQSQVKKEEA